MTDFDIQGAKNAGYSDAEIISHLSGSRSFDVDGARKAGYSDQEILSHLSTAPQDTAHHDEGITAIGKIRNYLGTGDANKKLDPNTMGDGPNMPAWATNVGLALSLIEPGIAVGSALKSGGPAAAQFVKEVLEHPKTVTAMKDAAVAWVKELPGVKALIQTGKSAGAVKDVIDDVRAARAVAEVPMAATPPPVPQNGVPVRPPLATKPIMTVPTETATPVRPPLAEKPATVDISEDVGLTDKLKDLARQEKIKAGLDPNVPLGEVKGGRYQNYFDEGNVRTNPKTGKLEHASDVIKSEERKASSTAEVANPARIADDIASKLAGRITTEQFDALTKDALAVMTRKYGTAPDSALVKMIRRRIAARSSEVTGPTTISIADLMKR